MDPSGLPTVRYCPAILRVNSFLSRHPRTSQSNLRSGCLRLASRRRLSPWMGGIQSIAFQAASQYKLRRPTLLKEARKNSVHHRLLVNTHLPLALFREPRQVLALLRSQKNRLLRGLLEAVAADTGPQEPLSFGASDILCRERAFGKFWGLILEMPRPTRAGEAYYVAVIDRSQHPVSSEVNLRASFPEWEGPLASELLYFTLEQARPSSSGEPCTVCCLRTTDGTSHFLGQGSFPDPESFVGFLTRYLMRRDF